MVVTVTLPLCVSCPLSFLTKTVALFLYFVLSLHKHFSSSMRPVAAPHPPKERVKLRPGPVRPSRLSSITRTSSSESNEGIKLLDRDLQIVTKKLNDLKKIPVDDSSLGRNGIGLSNSSPILSNEETIKLQLTEQIMTKLTDIDREVLTITGDTLISRARRSSRDSLLGSDLSCMPAHLTLIDRLMDFHVLIKRNEASTFSNATTNSKQNSRVSTPNETQAEASKYKQLLQEKDQEIANLNAKLESKECEVKKITSQLKTKDDEIKSKQTKHSNSLEELNKKNKQLLKEEMAKMNSAQEKEIEKQNIALQKLQTELQNATAFVSTSLPEDIRYIKELEAKVQQFEVNAIISSKTEGEEDSLQQQNSFLMVYLEKAIELLGSDDNSPSSTTTPEEIILIIESVDNQVLSYCNYCLLRVFCINCVKRYVHCLINIISILINNLPSLIQSNDTKSLMATLFGMIHSLKSQLAESSSLSRNYEEKIKMLEKKNKEDIKQERDTCTAVVVGLEDQLLKKKDEMSKLYLEMKEQKTQLNAVIDKNTITNQYNEDSNLVKTLQKLLAEANEQIHVLTQEQRTLTSQGEYSFYYVLHGTSQHIATYILLYVIDTFICHDAVAEFRHAFLDADEKCRDAEFLARVLTEEASRAKEANDDLRKKMADLTQTYLS